MMHTLPPANRFDDFFNDELYRSQKQRLFNYRLRRRKIARHVPPTGPILDIGSGTAPVSPDLSRTTLADLSAEALRHVDSREKAVMSITDMAFPDRAFDCVLCSEVLEHVPDDERAIAELRRVLTPGGTLVVTVPFQRRYWADDDDYVGHVRRYDPGELERKLAAGGFTSSRSYKLAGPFERWLTRVSLRQYRRNRDQFRKAPAWLLRAANGALFLLVLFGEAYFTWKRTTRILVVAR